MESGIILTDSDLQSFAVFLLDFLKFLLIDISPIKLLNNDFVVLEIAANDLKLPFSQFLSFVVGFEVLALW